jgi:hypothetical protein
MKADHMWPEECPSCGGEITEEHSCVMDPVTLRMECAGTVGPERYEELRKLSGIS